jgi:hypothetical protein
MPIYWILIILVLLLVIGAALGLKALGRPRPKK